MDIIERNMSVDNALHDFTLIKKKQYILFAVK